MITNNIHFPIGQDTDTRRRQLQWLIDHDQPFALARYRTTMSFVSDHSSWTYEIVLWQTRLGDDTTAAMAIDKEQFDILVHEFGLTRRHADPDGDGSIWALDDGLREAVENYRRETAALTAQIRSLSKAVATGGHDRQGLLRLRSRIASLRDEKRRRGEAFCRETGLLTLCLGGPNTKAA